jgi:hypothetical protein
MRRELEPVFLAKGPLEQEGLFLKLLGQTICSHEIRLLGAAPVSILKKLRGHRKERIDTGGPWMVQCSQKLSQLWDTDYPKVESQV